MIVNGTVSGDVYSTKHLELASKARVTGNVHYTLVEMAIGAEVNGSLTHTSDASKPAKDKGKDKAPQAEEPQAAASTPRVAPFKS